MNTETLIQMFLDVATTAEKNGKNKFVILGCLQIVSQAIAATAVKVKAMPASPIVPINAPLPPHLHD